MISISRFERVLATKKNTCRMARPISVLKICKLSSKMKANLYVDNLPEFSLFLEASKVLNSKMGGHEPCQMRFFVENVSPITHQKSESILVIQMRRNFTKQTCYPCWSFRRLVNLEAVSICSQVYFVIHASPICTSFCPGVVILLFTIPWFSLRS